MLAFINNIKIKTPEDATLRPLNAEERENIMPLFYRKSKPNFPRRCMAASRKAKMPKCHICSITIWTPRFPAVP